MKLALIPARAGSKRLPGKNTAMLGKKPLIEYTIEAVIRSQLFDRIIVSSDDVTVMNIACKYKDIETQNRPPELSTDSAKTIDVLLHILKITGFEKGVCGVFLPTCPFRTEQHIVEAVKMLSDRVDSVISVAYCDFPIAFCGELSSRGTDTLFEVQPNSPLLRDMTQSQTQKKMAHPNGAIYLSRIENIIKNKSFFKGKIAGYLMDRCSSVDIDTDIDLAFGRFLLKENRNKDDNKV